MLKENEKVITVKTGIASDEWDTKIIRGLEVGQTIIKEEP